METQDNRRKVFVDVVVQHDKNGAKKPLCIIFEDGKKYEIDKLCAHRRAAATRVGGTGIRYTIQVQGRETYLFEDEDRWFVEAKNLHV